MVGGGVVGGAMVVEWGVEVVAWVVVVTVVGAGVGVWLGSECSIQT